MQTRCFVLDAVIRTARRAIPNCSLSILPFFVSLCCYCRVTTKFLMFLCLIFFIRLIFFEIFWRVVVICSCALSQQNATVEKSDHYRLSTESSIKKQKLVEYKKNNKKLVFSVLQKYCSLGAIFFSLHPWTKWRIWST
jgi:hypothetical protein